MDKAVFDYQKFNSLSDFISKKRQELFDQKIANKNVLIAESLANIFSEGNCHGELFSGKKTSHDASLTQKQELFVKLANGKILSNLQFGTDFEFNMPKIKAKMMPFTIEESYPLIAGKIANIGRKLDVINDANDLAVSNRISLSYGKLSLLKHHDGDLEVLGRRGKILAIRFKTEAPSAENKIIMMEVHQDQVEFLKQISNIADIPEIPGITLSFVNEQKFYLDELLALKDAHYSGVFKIKEDEIDNYWTIALGSDHALGVSLERVNYNSDDTVFFTNDIPDECLKKIHPSAQLISAADLLDENISMRIR